MRQRARCPRRPWRISCACAMGGAGRDGVRGRSPLLRRDPVVDRGLHGRSPSTRSPTRGAPPARIRRRDRSPCRNRSPPMPTATSTSPATGANRRTGAKAGSMSSAPPGTSSPRSRTLGADEPRGRRGRKPLRLRLPRAAESRRKRASRKLVRYAPTTYEPASGHIAYGSPPVLVDSHVGANSHALAVDQGNGHLFGFDGGYVTEYGSAAEGNVVLDESLGAGELHSFWGTGLAVNAANGRVYVNDGHVVGVYELAAPHAEVADDRTLGDPGGRELRHRTVRRRRRSGRPLLRLRRRQHRSDLRIRRRRDLSGDHRPRHPAHGRLGGHGRQRRAQSERRLEPGRAVSVRAIRRDESGARLRLLAESRRMRAGGHRSLRRWRHGSRSRTHGHGRSLPRGDVLRLRIHARMGLRRRGLCRRAGGRWREPSSCRWSDRGNRGGEWARSRGRLPLPAQGDQCHRRRRSGRKVFDLPGRARSPRRARTRPFGVVYRRPCRTAVRTSW